MDVHAAGVACVASKGQGIAWVGVGATAHPAIEIVGAARGIPLRDVAAHVVQARVAVYHALREGPDLRWSGPRGWGVALAEGEDVSVRVGRARCPHAGVHPLTDRG